MTSQEYGECIVKERLREKLIGKLVNQFPKNKQDAEDVAQRALLLASKRSTQFPNVQALSAYLFEVATGRMINLILLAKERRRLSKQGLLSGKSYNPQRRLDWKIDLENAVKETTHNLRLRQALWEHVYVGYDIDELSVMLGTLGGVKAATWRDKLFEAKRKLQRIMKRKGYR